MTDMIKSSDINPKHVRDSDHFNRVRKAWALQVPKEFTEKLNKVPGVARLQLYKTFDDEVTQLWIDAMKRRNDGARDAGAKMINVDGYHRFEDAFIYDNNELLLEVALNWVNVNLKAILETEVQ